MPLTEGAKPEAHPRLQTVPFGAMVGQFPAVKGNKGVGCEQLRSVLLSQYPFPTLNNTPRLQDAVRLPFAIYLNAHPKEHVAPDAIGPMQLPVVLGKLTLGVEHGLGWHVAAGG